MIGRKLHCSLGFLSIVCVWVACVSPAVAVPTIDTATQGNWVGVYGSSGYILPDYIHVTPGDGIHTPVKTTANDLASLPSWITSYSYAGGAQGYVWDDVIISTDLPNYTRAPQDPTNPLGDRHASTAFNGGDFSINVLLNDATEFQLGVYGLDWDSLNRSIEITVNGETVAYNGVDYINGLWGLWDLSLPAGAFTISVDHLGGTNATISAITFDEIIFIPESSTLPLWSLLGAASSGLIIWRRRAK